MMNLNKKDLKTISYDFRCISNRLLNVHYDDYISVLKKFLSYLDDTPILFDYISSSKRLNFNIKSEFEDILNDITDEPIDLGSTDEEEIYTINTLLRYIIEKKSFNYYTLGRVYSNETKYNSIIKDFNNRVTLIFINHLSAYLTKIGIMMGYDEEVKFMITNYNGQVNISKDSSTLNATQNIGATPDELAILISAITNSLNDSIEKEHQENILDSVETLQSELQSPSPKKGLIRTCISGLKTNITYLPAATELCKNINELIQLATQALS